MTDPDAPGGEYLHWYVLIILKSDQICDNAIPESFKQFRNNSINPTLYRLATDVITVSQCGGIMIVFHSLKPKWMK